jgi:IS605 OrfB family transposase
MNQKNIINEWIHTSRYIYNKALHLIHNGHSVNHFQLRDKLVTEKTKKNNDTYQLFTTELSGLQTRKKQLEKIVKTHQSTSPEYVSITSQLTALNTEINDKKKSRSVMCKQLSSEKTVGINDWELNTPKAVRDTAISDLCKAYKTGMTNLKVGNIKHFRIHFKKKTNPNQCVGVPKSLIKINDGVIELAPTFFKDDNKIVMGKKTNKKYRTLIIEHDTRIIKQKGEYWLIVPVEYKKHPNIKLNNYCGVDPGVRTFMTTFGNKGGMEYKHNEEMLQSLRNKMDTLKVLRVGKRRRRIHKKTFNKIENRKSNIIDELHWKVIHHLLDENDVIFYGDIKSHDIVKHNKNKKLNRNVNDLKFYKFKERLLFKASERHKRIVLVKEQYTSQTCSNCGAMYKPGCSKIYHCTSCTSIMDRDMNASKNILMKGILSL